MDPPPHNYNGPQHQAPQQPDGRAQFMPNPYPQGHYFAYPPPGHYHPHYPPPAIPVAAPQYPLPAHYPPVMQHHQYQGQMPMAQVVNPPQGERQAVQGLPIPARGRPNAETRPGVYKFKVDIIEGNTRHDFEEHTDSTWTDFRPRVVGRLENPNVELVCKVTSEPGKATQLKNEEDYKALIDRLLQKVQTARTKAAGLEIRNIAKAAVPKKAAKRRRDEDVPPELDEEQSSQLKSYKILEPSIRCETHGGHCFVTRQGGVDNHYRVDHSEMALWAKQMSLGKATKYCPPHCLQFDRGPTKKRRLQNAPTELVLRIENVTSDANPSAVAGSSSITTARIISGSQGAPQPLTGSRIVNTHTGTEVPFLLPDSGFIPPSFPPPEPMTPTNAPSELPTISPPFPSFDRLPRSKPSPAKRPEFVSGSSSAGSEYSLFPSISEVIHEANEQRPGLGLGSLELDLSFSGVTDSSQLLLVPEEVLSIAGNISLPKIRIIRNIARRMILPRLGFRGMYNEPELPEDDFGRFEEESHISDEENGDEVEGESEEHGSDDDRYDISA